MSKKELLFYNSEKRYSEIYSMRKRYSKMNGKNIFVDNLEDIDIKKSNNLDNPQSFQRKNDIFSSYSKGRKSTALPTRIKVTFDFKITKKNSDIIMEKPEFKRFSKKELIPRGFAIKIQERIIFLEKRMLENLYTINDLTDYQKKYYDNNEPRNFDLSTIQPESIKKLSFNYIGKNQNKHKQNNKDNNNNKNNNNNDNNNNKNNNNNDNNNTNGKYTKIGNKYSKELTELIDKMLKEKYQDRISINDIINYDYFISMSKKLNLYYDVNKTVKLNKKKKLLKNNKIINRDYDKKLKNIKNNISKSEQKEKIKIYIEKLAERYFELKRNVEDIIGKQKSNKLFEEITQDNINEIISKYTFEFINSEIPEKLKILLIEFFHISKNFSNINKII